ncbi:MAG: hypothetical protein ACP5GI_01830 [Sulfolobales archaeon]
MMRVLSEDEKQRLIKTLEEDREFRYALMGLLGFKEILDRITRIEERQQKLEERQQELEERMIKLEERMIKLEERMIELAERQQKLEERMIQVETELIYVRRLSELNRRDISAISEALYSRWVLETVEKEISAKGERIVGVYRNYVVKDKEIDLVIETDQSIYCVEVKIQPNHHDIDDLLNKAETLRNIFKKQIIPILVGSWIGRETIEYAKNKHVRVITY